MLNTEDLTQMYIEFSQETVQMLCLMTLSFSMRFSFLQARLGSLLLHMGGNDQSGRYALSVSVFVSFHGDPESR